jgi:hypothetical protein
MKKEGLDKINRLAREVALERLGIFIQDIPTLKKYYVKSRGCVTRLVQKT